MALERDRLAVRPRHNAIQPLQLTLRVAGEFRLNYGDLRMQSVALPGFSESFARRASIPKCEERLSRLRRQRSSISSGFSCRCVESANRKLPIAKGGREVTNYGPNPC